MLLNNCKINLWETGAKITQKEEIPPNEWGHEDRSERPVEAPPHGMLC